MRQVVGRVLAADQMLAPALLNLLGSLRLSNNPRCQIRPLVLPGGASYDDSLQLVAGLHEPTLDRDGRRPRSSRRSRLTLVAEGDDRVKAFTDARHERAQVRDRCGVDVDADQRLVVITHQRDVGGGADRGPEGEDAEHLRAGEVELPNCRR